MYDLWINQIVKIIHNEFLKDIYSDLWFSVATVRFSYDKVGYTTTKYTRTHTFNRFMSRMMKCVLVYFVSRSTIHVNSVVVCFLFDFHQISHIARSLLISTYHESWLQFVFSIQSALYPVLRSKREKEINIRYRHIHDRYRVMTRHQSIHTNVCSSSM